MNNKWIVPIVAIVLCAVSLIGAGYAAYSATLTDTENATVENNYLKLTFGDNTASQYVDVDWKQESSYSSGNWASMTYTPLPSGDNDEIMFVFSVDFAKSVGGGDAYGTPVSETNYSLTLSVLSGTATDLGTFTASVYTYADGAAVTAQTATSGAYTLTYGSYYCVVVDYVAGSAQTYTQGNTYADEDAAFSAFATYLSNHNVLTVTATVNSIPAA